MPRPIFVRVPHPVSSGRAARIETIQNLLKPAALLFPIDPADNRAQVSFVEALHVWQEEDQLLDIRSEIEQFHDLGHAGSRHSAVRSDSKGQDLIDYALMLAFVAVAAGAVLPGAASSIGALFSQVGSVMKSADSSSDETLKHRDAISK